MKLEFLNRIWADRNLEHKDLHPAPQNSNTVGMLANLSGFVKGTQWAAVRINSSEISVPPHEKIGVSLYGL